MGGSIVLIIQDGVQLAPLSFPSGASLTTFLTCLEQGLNPDGRLDPPLFHKNESVIGWPKLKKNIFPDKLKTTLQDKEEFTQDYVFRVVFSSPASNIGMCASLS